LPTRAIRSNQTMTALDAVGIPVLCSGAGSGPPRLFEGTRGAGTLICQSPLDLRPTVPDAGGEIIERSFAQVHDTGGMSRATAWAHEHSQGLIIHVSGFVVTPLFMLLVAFHHPLVAI
jgi:hypothetical protein